MLEQKSVREAYVTFLECEIRGGWKNIQETARIKITSGDETIYKAWAEPAEIWLVRSDGLRRNFSFRNEAVVRVFPGMIHFRHEDFLGEIMVDEDEKAGKEPKSKLGFT